MYFGLRQIAALPTRWTRATKTAKKQSKGMQAPHWPTRSKKARPRQVPLKFLSCFLFSMVKILTGALLFSLACMSHELSFFPVFSLWEWLTKSFRLI
jgi:hypothetical protein